MERLYTEAQWRAIARIEQLSDSYIEPHLYDKRIFGPLFADGEYYLQPYVPYYVHPHHFGPPKHEFFVYERLSNARITGEAGSKAEALAVARRRIADAGPFYMEKLAKLRADFEEYQAREEARAAIVRAKAERKTKAPGRRRREIFAAGNGLCHYCKTKLDLTGDWEVDHKMPKALGGSNERINLVATCVPCNRSKKDKTDIEFFALIASRVPA